MKTCLAIRYVAFEDLGIFSAVLEQSGFCIDYVQAGVDDITEAQILAADLCVILGGPIAVYDHQRYPFLIPMIALVQARLASKKALLGVCLGAQLIAQASGAAVYPGPAQEIGWASIDLTPAGQDSVLAPFAKVHGVRVLHWHGDTFDLPLGAQWLAATSVVPHQAFSLGKQVLALQFHVEVDTNGIERWLIGHACELSHAGLDPCQIRADSVLYGPAAAIEGVKMLKNWLLEAGLL